MARAVARAVAESARRLAARHRDLGGWQSTACGNVRALGDNDTSQGAAAVYLAEGVHKGLHHIVLGATGGHTGVGGICMSE